MAEYIDLNGTWNLQKKGEDAAKGIVATVPGCVHNDLLAAEKIPNPYYRDNEDHMQWIGETDWVYQRAFKVEDTFLAKKHIFLRCGGLDTLATISINGSEVGKTDNMFRSWEFDIKSLLKSGENTIAIHFHSTIPVIDEAHSKRPLFTCGAGDFVFRYDGSPYIRKEQCNFGWDWGPMLITCGIWRDIGISAACDPVIEAVDVKQRHQENGTVALTIASEIEFLEGNVHSLEVSLLCGSETVASGETPLEGDRAITNLVVEKPLLWWPNGMGKQPLYDLEVRLKNGATTIDEHSQRIGLRRLELVQKDDQWGRSFHFEANGIPFFAKGANWIPADTFDCRVTEDDLYDLIQSSADANMNFLRVWGGGLYERDTFYDICDELGICVWQDFMFACAAYPAFDPAFMESVRFEAIDNVKRIRHHACLALWCGNNELEQIPRCIGDGEDQMPWNEYSALFDELLAKVVEEHDTGRAYIPSSEYSPVGDRSNSSDPRWGDAHLWNVWHGRQPFEWYRTSYHRFCSEFGFQSFPEPVTIESYTEPRDRNFTSYIMERHQRSPIGNGAILSYMQDWFRVPEGFEQSVWSSQMLQALAIKYAVEHWRMNMPRCMGAIYWQLNDCWPVASWASIDSDHRWKALHYTARKFFAPQLIVGVEHVETSTLSVHSVNDALEPIDAVCCIEVTDTDGKSLDKQSLELTLVANGTQSVGEFDYKALAAEHTQRRLLMWLTLTDKAGNLLARNLVTFIKPKHLELEVPSLEVFEIEEWGDGFAFKVKANCPALYSFFEYRDAVARFSDNFFHLQADEIREITVEFRGDAPTKEIFERGIKALSLIE